MSDLQTQAPRLSKGPQVEREYGIKEKTLRSYVREGILSCVRVGRQVFYDRHTINAFIEAGGTAWDGGWRKEPYE